MAPEEFNKRLSLLRGEFAIVITNAPFVQSQDLLGRILGRVFVNGKDSNNNAIGQYAGSDSKSKGRYKAKRNAAGRRIDTVDLQFTGALFESIKNGHAGEGEAIIGFNNLKEAKIGRYNEKRYEKDIFAPTKEEQEETKRLMADYIKAEMNARIRAIFNG